MSEKKAGSRLLPLLIILIVIIVAAGAAFFLLSPKTSAQAELERIIAEYSPVLPEDCDAADRLIADKFEELFSIDPETALEESFRSASALVKLSYLDISSLTNNLAPEMQDYLADFVSQAKRRSEIYAEDGTYLPELQYNAYTEAIKSRLKQADEHIKSINIRAELIYGNDGWQLVNGNDFLSFAIMSSDPNPGFHEAAAKLELIDFTYKLEDLTSPGPVPDASCYGETDDPSVISALLETPEAKKLIKGQPLSWNADIELIPGTTIRYYLDETILSIVWQEVEHGAVGTFAEVFISDASQLRRKIANDDFGSMGYYYPTELAAQSNAVLAVSGDFYDLPNRVYGLYVYDGQLRRSCLYAGQACMFDSNGDMIFTYENQFATEEEAQKFIDENKVMFSLSFGPVILDKGVDVLPYDYPLGEIRDTYARCVIGQLGEKHYLAMTINCLSPDYYVYVTLRQAADSMIEHGCYNAYTLDGGQTGSIILGNELINPVQFGVEKAQSDIFYFATAIPSE